MQIPSSDIYGSLNLAMAVQMVGTAEALNMGENLGMDAKILASIMNTSTSRCWSGDTYNPCPGVLDGVTSPDPGLHGSRKPLRSRATEGCRRKGETVKL